MSLYISVAVQTPVIYLELLCWWAKQEYMSIWVNVSLKNSVYTYRCMCMSSVHTCTCTRTCSVFSRASAHCKSQQLRLRDTSFYRGRLPVRMRLLLVYVPRKTQIIAFIFFCSYTVYTYVYIVFTLISHTHILWQNFCVSHKKGIYRKATHFLKATPCDFWIHVS